MGQTARRVEQRPAGRRQPRPHLVETAPAKASRARDARAHARTGEARARALFGTFLFVLIALVALGSARVALIVRATEMSISETRLQAEIKAQRVEGDQLEVDRSSLSTPSRIESIASTTMQMGRPLSVRYITLPGGEVTATPEATSPRAAASVTGAHASALDAVLGAILDMSAGEAQSLLVGELGLAGSR
jgi:cell division protein FtsL